MKNKIFVIIFIVLVFSFQSVHAQEGHLKLLAVTSEGQGVDADLNLRIMPGTGRVFIDTYPLTRIDTQMSTRFAKDIACKFLEKDCSSLDFFYTITSQASIVGGPSAGAAISALTVSLLEGYTLDGNITVTGTINSGGLVGSVGSIKSKIEIASEIGLKKVLIPKGERYLTNTSFNNETNQTQNETIDLYEVGQNLSVEVIEVANLYDVLYEFIGERKYELLSGEIVPEDWYIETMEDIAVDLCERNIALHDELGVLENDSVYEIAFNLSQNSEQATASGDYYSAASFCFGSNTKLSYLLLKRENLTEDQLSSVVEEINESIQEMENKVNNINIQTITDLQTYIVVKERLLDADDTLTKVQEFYFGNNSVNETDDKIDLDLDGEIDAVNETEQDEKNDAAILNLAYAIERLNSAVAWSSYFGQGNSKFKLDIPALNQSCVRKQKEAEERVRYIQIISALTMDDVMEQLNDAKLEEQRGNYIFCLFKASKAKAETDTVMGIFGTKEESVKEVIDTRLELANDVILKQQNQGIFPILGYSYYEYAKTLQGDDSSSALVYAHYALEFSNLDMYFEKEIEDAVFFDIDTEMASDNMILAFIVGFISGILAAVIVISFILHKQKKCKIEGKAK